MKILMTAMASSPVEWCRDFEVAVSAEHFLAAVLPPEDFDHFEQEMMMEIVILSKGKEIMVILMLGRWWWWIHLTWKTFIFGGDALRGNKVRIGRHLSWGQKWEWACFCISVFVFVSLSVNLLVVTSFCFRLSISLWLVFLVSLRYSHAWKKSKP